MKEIFLLLIVFCFISCKNTNENDLETEKKYLGFEDMPNRETKYKKVLTENSADNLKLFNALKSKLEKASFKLTKQKDIRKLSFNDCEDNLIISIDGNGIRQYYARSHKSEKALKNTYADFSIWVYEFSTPKIAKQNYDLLEKAFNSKGRFCNGKAPEKLVINGNEVFHLSTRAEMFRTYTEKYGEIIKNYQLRKVFL
ncbi:MAG: hypothetical protein H7239_09290 [Flavobacterium sp.]|nr:hypothetical protein [Flavobacterium sp.]